MPAPVRVDRLIDQADRVLRRIEATHLQAVERSLRRALSDLEAELRRLYPLAREELATTGTLGNVALREARARILIAQVEATLKAFEVGSNATGVPQAVSAAIRESYEAGLTSAADLMRRFEPELSFGATFQPEAVEAAITNTTARLARHGADFVTKAQDVIVSGLVRGEGVRVVARRLREETGILLWEAKRIVRTETIQAADVARRASFQQAGIEYVQRIGTQDSRICGYCLARHGRVYRVEEAPAAIHPNDRCANLPFRFEWLEDGRIDLKWWQQSRETLRERSPEKPKWGLAPFEKAAGLESPPKHYWEVP